MASVNKRPQSSNSTPSKGANTSTSPRPPGSSRQSSTGLTANGLGRSPSLRGPNGTPRPQRPNTKKPTPNTSFLNTNANVSDDASEDDARAENNALMEELRERVRKAEAASEEYQRQLSTLETRLNESMREQAKLEERVHESEAQINDLEDEKVKSIRLARDTERNFESERSAMLKDKEQQTSKDEEQQSVIQRLKETLAQREPRGSTEDDRGLSRSSSFRSRVTADAEKSQFAPPSSLQRSDSYNSSQLVMQKDKLIESLRLELAETQLRVAELENLDGGKVQELEKNLLETRIANARLMEDNESFQLLLNEKTLNGDISKSDLLQHSLGLGSLAEELESAEGESENYRRLEVEVKSLRDANKALTLYVENIIGRLLQHQEFENVLEKNPDLMSGKPRPPSSGANVDKELPPPPPPKEDENQPTSLLQRARSVVAGAGGPRRQRPISQIFSSTQAPTPNTITSPPLKPQPETANEDPTTAPSIPINRHPHRRSQSDMPAPLTGAPLVNQMYRGPPSGGSPLMSPRLSPSTATAARSSFFSPTPTPPTSQPGPTNTSRVPTPSSTTQPPTAPTRIASAPGAPKPGSSSNSTFSDNAAEVSSTSSPPRNVSGHGPQYTGAVMTQNRLRPLRLVRENAGDAGSEEEREREREREKARKKANRGSWMPGWMNRE